MTSRHPDFRADLQALRGIAVLLVVAFHAWPAAVPGGFVGVDVFFVISGYLITGLLLREMQHSGRIDFAAFYARRVRRLLPAAALVITTTVLAVVVLRSPLEAAQVTATAIAAACYVANLWFAHLAVDYLHEGLQRNLLLHTWSLAVEEQFYLLWPAMLMAASLLFKRLGTTGAVGWTIGVVSLASFGVCLWMTRALPPWAFFGLPSRAWELGAGAATALCMTRAHGVGRGLRQAMVGLGLFAILAAALTFSSRTPFPGPGALIPVLGAVLVLLGGAAPDDRGGPGLHRVGVLQRLGDLSYAWYLWHWPVLIGLIDAWPAASRNLQGLAAAVVSLALARLTFTAIEEPIRHHAALQARPARSLWLGLLLTLVTVAFAFGARSYATQNAHLRRAMEAVSKDRPRLYDQRCFAAALDSEPRDCVYGVSGATATIVLVGDSHAAQWFPALERLALVRNARLVVFVKAACPLATVETFDRKLNRPYFECTQWRTRVFERITQLRPLLVVAANAGQYEPFVTNDRQAQARWREGLDLSLRQLRAAARHVVLLRDTPRPGFSVPACLAKAYTQPAATTPRPCDYLLHDPALVAAFEVERTSVAGLPGVAIVDMNDAICMSVVCAVEKDGMVLFHDSQHLSASFARSLADLLWQRLPPSVHSALAR